jgi:hypothetical protein
MSSVNSSNFIQFVTCSVELIFLLRKYSNNFFKHSLAVSKFTTLLLSFSTSSPSETVSSVGGRIDRRRIDYLQLYRLQMNSIPYRSRHIQNNWNHIIVKSLALLWHNTNKWSNFQTDLINP